MTIDNMNESHLFAEPDGTPKRSLLTPWLRTNKGFCRVHLTIIGPKPEEPKNYLPLSRSEAQDFLKEAARKVISLIKELR